MDAFLTSTAVVAIAEMGDKTQLLSLLLAAKFRNKSAIVLGILVATLLNHAASAWLGAWLVGFVSSSVGHWLLAGSFILVGLWLLVPDKEEAIGSRFDQYGAFAVSLGLFFLAEIGDKTQVATVLLAAEFQSVVWVTAGTTLGMLAANVPVVYLGARLMEKIPFQLTRRLAAALFILMGVLALL